MISVRRMVLESANSQYRVREINSGKNIRQHYWEWKPPSEVFQKIENAVYLNPRDVDYLFSKDLSIEEVSSYLENKISSFKSENMLPGGKVFWKSDLKKELIYSGNITKIKED